MRSISQKNSRSISNIVFLVAPTAFIPMTDTVEQFKRYKDRTQDFSVNSPAHSYKPKTDILTFSLKMLISYGALPYKWNHDREFASNAPSLLPQTSQVKMTLYYLNLICVNCFNFRMWVGLFFIGFNFDDDKFRPQLIPQAANASVFAIACLINSSVYFKCNELIAFLNQYFIFMENHLQTRSAREAKNLENVQRILFAIFTTIPFLNGFLYFSQSGGIRYMSSIFPSDSLTWSIHVVLAIWEILWMLNCLNTYFTAYIFVAFITNVPYWVRNLKKNTQEYDRANSADSNSNNRGQKSAALHPIILEYRSMQLLDRVFNEFFAPIIVPGHKVVGIILSVCAICGCIKMFNVIPMPGFMFMPALVTMYIVFTAASFPKASAVRLVSIDLIQSGRRALTNDLRVFFRSASPLTVDVGHYYVYGRSTLGTFWGIIINNSISLLMLSL